MSKFTDKLKERGIKDGPRSEPLWKGPLEDGITFSMLSRFIVCRERFRLYAIEGLRPSDMFNHRLEFGNMWHVCEEVLAEDGVHFGDRSSVELMDNTLAEYRDELVKRYPLQQRDIINWYNICKLMFPIYVNHWKQDVDTKSRVPMMQEQVFDVPYSLPSGRKVRLRGKWDSVDLIDDGIWLQENKTKGDVNEGQILRQLSFDLQTMMYLVALNQWQKDCPVKARKGVDGPEYEIEGVRYNVIRRPRQYQGKKETESGFYNRLRNIVDTTPDEFFYRWKVYITRHEVFRFRVECLDPILEELCDWYSGVVNRRAEGIDVFDYQRHWRHPFGVYNTLDEGGSTDLDHYLESGSMVGLRRVDKLFEELS